MAERRMRVQADVAGAPPEQVLVLEVAGSVSNFVRAVQLMKPPVLLKSSAGLNLSFPNISELVPHEWPVDTL